MPVPSHLQPILSFRRIVLWVEDWITKEYLDRIWSPDDKFFNILVGGGKETIRGTVHDLREQDNSHVFGLVDKDFGQSNRSHWSNHRSEIEVFVPTFFELENYLLSWPALAGCKENRLQRSEADIQRQAESLAQGMTWWMACRRLLSDYRDRLIGDYPTHPKIDNIQNLSEAENYIKAQEWYRNIQSRAASIGEDSALSSDLSSAHSDQQNKLSSNRWVQEFSGKEIFRRIRGFLCNESYARPSDMDVNLAKAIADWQVENNQIPDDLNQLRIILKNRVGLPIQ